MSGVLRGGRQRFSDSGHRQDTPKVRWRIAIISKRMSTGRTPVFTSDRR